MKKIAQTMLVAVVALVASVHCGPPGPEKAEIALADHADALTTAAGDNLFTLTLTKASKGYAVANLSISAGLPGQTATVVNFTHADTNGNGLMDTGETLTCKEPVVNLFDGTTVGKAVTIGFAENETGTFFQVASGTWTPAN